MSIRLLIASTALLVLALASTEVVEIRGARRRAERPSTSLARCAAA
jgi:hypothetical protein